MMSIVLAGHGLTKKYGSTIALAGVDVEVGERDSLAIMGPSGSGKSTLLHTLAGIIRPDDGQVLLRGERSEMGVPPAEVPQPSAGGATRGRIDNLGENKLSALRRKRFGFVFQFGQLLPELPAEENVALPLMLSAGLSRAATAGTHGGTTCSATGDGIVPGRPVLSATLGASVPPSPRYPRG
jgi:putative ABC transport system ATP-binding protein